MFNLVNLQDQSAHHPNSVVTLNEIILKLTKMRDRTVAIDIKGQDNHPEVKDSLGMMSNTNSAPMEVISVLLLYPHAPIHSQGHYQLHVKKADYKHL